MSFMSVAPQRPVILIVDDQPENLVVLSAILERDFRVRAAISGEAALRAVEHPPAPDLVILDIMMPHMDGFEVLRRLQALPVMQDVPVIFATAMTGEDDEETGIELGAADYVTKPLRPGVVLARVKAHLDAALARRMLRDRNSELEREVARRLRDFYLVQDVALRALASLAEARDSDTGNHILRTQAYVGVLASHLAAHPSFPELADPERRQTIVKAAPLHDIGKVGIPDHILLKPGPLTSDELMIMRGHPLLGAMAIQRALDEARRVVASDILSGVRSAGDAVPKLAFLEAAHDIARWHHERWDGAGYPDGLAGNAIPVSARLMALADVYDALISRRIYKEAWPLEKVEETIRQSAGKQFDPDVCEAFTANASQFAEIARKYSDHGGDA